MTGSPGGIEGHSLEFGQTVEMEVEGIGRIRNRVTRVDKRAFGIWQDVEAEPTVDFSRLEEALIVMTDIERCESAKRRPSKH